MPSLGPHQSLRSPLYLFCDLLSQNCTPGVNSKRSLLLGKEHFALKLCCFILRYRMETKIVSHFEKTFHKIPENLGQKLKMSKMFKLGQ